MFFALVAFLIFTAALFAAAYYLFSVPQQQEQQVLAGRLRELRVRTGMRAKTAPDLLRREQRGSLAFLGDFVSWVAVLDRLQECIAQANLKYRAAEVAALSILLAVGVYFLTGVLGLSLIALRILAAFLIGALPVFYILRVRRRRLRKFEESFPDAIDLFNRSM